MRHFEKVWTENTGVIDPLSCLLLGLLASLLHWKLPNTYMKKSGTTNLCGSHFEGDATQMLKE